MPPAPSSSRALAAILPLVASGQPYEAHQKARTFAARYNKSQHYDVAIDVLFQSAREMLKAGQQGSGVDLTGFLLEVYENKGEEVNEESRGRLTQLIALTGSDGQWRKTIIDKSISWSAKHGPCPAGDPDLQHYVGELLYKESEFESAEPHLLASGKRDSARVLANMMVEWSSSSTGSKPGDFALRGTIPYLQNGNILAAHTFITHFTQTITSRSPNLLSSSQPPESPVTLTTDSVLNFCQLAVLTCQRASGDKNRVARESWVRLCGTYQSRGGVLTQVEVRRALQEISQLYFNISPPRQQNANPFGDMLSSLFGGPPGGAGAGGGAPQQRRLAPSAPGTPGLD